MSEEMKSRILILLAVISGWSLDSSGQAIAADPIKEKTIQLPGRVRLAYVEQGAKNGQPVILLHGFPDSWHSYSQVLPYLPPSLHVYVLSQRGHGNSDRPRIGYQPEDFAADVAAFMKELRISPAVIVGHSMGSVVAQSFGLRYPDLTKSLVLIGSFAELHTKPAMVEFGKMVSALQDPIDKSMADEFQRSTIKRPVSPEYFDTLLIESMKVKADVWRQVFNSLLKFDHTEALKSLRKPTLLVWGDQDVLISRQDQDLLLDLIPGSKLIVYEGTGHSLQWEEPRRFAEDLLAFIQQSNK
jgi:non-heme chloroperoxidase